MRNYLLNNKKMEELTMGNMAKDNAASNRILGLLDAGSFVEIGGAITARTTDFNMQE